MKALGKKKPFQVHFRKSGKRPRVRLATFDVGGVSQALPTIAELFRAGTTMFLLQGEVTFPGRRHL